MNILLRVLENKWENGWVKNIKDKWSIENYIEDSKFLHSSLGCRAWCKHLGVAVLVKGMCCPWSCREGRTLPAWEENELRIWKEFGNAVAESTLSFTDSLQVLNISESREKHLSPIAATFQPFLLCLKWKSRLECGCIVGNAFQEEGASHPCKHRLLSELPLRVS